MSSQPIDDGFHEIQLNGKQLVFLFMAATVVSVVIFLCGVLVGRGVHAERASSAVADGSTLGAPPLGDVSPSQPPAPPGTPAGSDPTKAAAPPAADDLSYFNRLEKSTPPPEELRPVEQKPAAAAPAEKRAVPAASRAADPAAASALTAGGEPSGSGFALQLAALRDRGEAEAIARRLSSKGYAAYVVTPPNGTPQVYRVRVGKFKTRHEAESVAAKLHKDEQFTPWITR